MSRRCTSIFSAVLLFLLPVASLPARPAPHTSAPLMTSAVQPIARARTSVAQKACRNAIDPKAAIAACSKALGEDPSLAWALVKRGNARLEIGDMTGSLQDADSLLELDFGRADGYLLRARIFFEEGNLAEVEASASRAIISAPNSAIAHYYLALSVDRPPLGGKLGEAQAAIDRALELEPTNMDFKVLRARLTLREDEDTDKALVEIDEAISQEPDKARHHVDRGAVLWQAGEPHEALAAAETALSLNGRLAEAFELRGKLLYEAGNVTGASADLQQALTFKPGLIEASQLHKAILAQAIPKRVKTSCDVLNAAAEALAAGTFAVDATSVRVGEAISVAWSIPAAGLRPDQPTYVVMLMPEEVRLEGSGFFGLAPGAPGPYDMEYGRSKLRAIVPLHIANASRSGTVTILPYRAGAFTLEWNIVQMSACGETKIVSSGGTSVDVAPGIPNLVLRDQYATAAPTSVITTTQRPYAAVVYPEFVEVIDKSTGETILQTPGTDPDFSPSGRFLVTSTPETDCYDVFDLVAVRKLGRFCSLGLYWSNGDSFLFLDIQAWGQVSILRTLHGRRYGPRDPVVSEQWLDDDEEAAKVEASEDIGPLSGEGGLFTTGSEAWALELSVEAGVIALRNASIENSDGQVANGSGSVEGLPLGTPEDVTQADYVVDLAKRRPDRGLHKKNLDALLAQDYGIVAAILGWNVHGPLYQALIASGPKDMSWSPVRTVPYFSQEEETPEQITSGEEDARRVDTPRGAVSLTSANTNPLAVGTVAGSQLNHLTTKRVERLRSGEDNDKLDDISMELESVIPKSVGTFGENLPYADRTPSFPDPYVPLDEPVVFDLHASGRDLWRGRAADQDFWLTQSVSAGRNAHSHELSMLARGSDGRVRHADLLAQANEYLTRKMGKDLSAAFEMFNRKDVRGELGEAFDTPSAVTISGDRYLMIATRPVPHLVAFDLRKWSIVCAIPEPRNASDISEVVMHLDRQHITQINTNGHIEVYSCADGSNILSGLYVDGELVVIDQSGYFDGSEDAAEYVELTIPGLPGRHVLSQFSGVLRRNGLAGNVLSGERTAASLPLGPPSLSVRLGGKRFDVVGRSNVGLQSISVFAGGRSVEKINISGKTAELAVPVAVAGNSGLVTFVATDKAGIMSAPVEIVLPEHGAKKVGKLFAVAVGVDAYRRMPKSDLNFAVADAKRIVKVAKAAKFYRDRSVKVLTNSAATSDAIVSSLKAAVDKAGVDDTILVSFAGHGLVAEDQSLRLALSGTRLDDLVDTSLSFDQVLTVLKGAKARVVVLLDVCHSGLANRSRVATNDAAASLLTTASGSGIVIFSASKGRQYSEETPLLRGGRFSTAIEATVGKNKSLADSDLNGRISLKELYRAVKADVANGSDGRQTPWLARNQIFGDFDLF